jgi:hypothetical protein
MANVAQLLVEKNGFADRVQVRRRFALNDTSLHTSLQFTRLPVTGDQGEDGGGGAAGEG